MFFTSECEHGNKLETSFRAYVSPVHEALVLQV